MSSINMRGTTICCVRRGNDVTVAGDGQVTLGDTVMKHGARKVRKIRDGKILIGFAGSTADAMCLFEMFEAKLDEHAHEHRPDRQLGAPLMARSDRNRD